MLDVAFLPPAAPSAPDVAVVIDVLRMTSTAAMLFSRQLAELTVIAGSAEATALARATDALLLGEREGVPLPGFDGGNSPLEHVSADLTGQRAVLCTSNGSKAVEVAAAARHLLLGAIVNARAVAERALTLATDDIVLICSGTDGRVSLDDVLGAGCIAREVLRAAPQTVLTDATRIALLLAERQEGLFATLNEAGHSRTLLDLDFAADLEFAVQLNSLAVVPERHAAGPARFSAA